MASHRPPAGGHAPAGTCGAEHVHAVVHGCASGPSAVDVLGGGVPWVDARMAAVHVLATVAAGLALRQGDRLLAALVAALRPRRRPPTTVSHPVPAPAAAPVDVPAVVPQAVVRVTRRRRRGPPRRVALAPCAPG